MHHVTIIILSTNCFTEFVHSMHQPVNAKQSPDAHGVRVQVMGKSGTCIKGRRVSCIAKVWSSSLAVDSKTLYRVTDTGCCVHRHSQIT